MAIALDGTPTIAQGDATSPITIVGHAASGADRLAIVVLAWLDDATETVTSVVRNSQTFDPVGSAIVAGGAAMQAFYRIAPSTGSHNTVITMSAQCLLEAAIITFTGVHQVAPFDGYLTHSDFSAVGNPPAITSAVGDLVFDFFGNAVGTNPTPDGSQSSLLTITPDYKGIGASTKAGAASVTMAWTPATENWWQWLGFNINAAAGDNGLSVSIGEPTIGSSSF